MHGKNQRVSFNYSVQNKCEMNYVAYYNTNN
jgi:hypothetical protein